MQCPRCQKELSRTTAEGVELDRCVTCRGVFLEHGELNRVAEPTAGDLEYSTVHAESFRHGDSFGPAHCPRCSGSEMKKVEFNVHSGIILDYCEGCRGFWLDGQELERINAEVHEMNEAAAELGPPAISWLARFLWSLPR